METLENLTTIDKLNTEATDSLMGTQELKSHSDSQDESCLLRLYDQLQISQRSQVNYENLIQSLYTKLNSALQENKKLFEINEKLQKSLNKFQQDYSSKVEQVQIRCEQKVKKVKENLEFLIKDRTQSTIAAISEKLHMEQAILKKNLKAAYKQKLKKKQKKWTDKYQALDNFYQESLRSLQLLHIHRLADSTKATESLLQKFLNP